MQSLLWSHVTKLHGSYQQDRNLALTLSSAAATNPLADTSPDSLDSMPVIIPGDLLLILGL